MVLENRLYFMVPNPISTTAIGFTHPVTVSAEALSVSTADILIQVREGKPNDLWIAGVALEYNKTVYTNSKAIPKKSLDTLLKAPSNEHSKMVDSKRFLYGVASMLAGKLAEDSGLDVEFLTNCIKKFAKPDHNLVTDVSTGGVITGFGLQEEASKLPGVDQIAVCPALHEEYMRIPNHRKSVCTRTSAPIYSLVIHLNDGHRWTREQIADWLDKLYEQGVDLAFKDAE